MNDLGTICYFLGANSPMGFISRFDRVFDAKQGWRVYLLKGGPGTGKSSLMKRIALRAEDESRFVERIFCSSDPDSLDGVILPNEKRCILDATSPHVLEPKHPGVCENILHTGEFWDEGILRGSSAEIIRLSGECSALHARASRYLSAAGSLLTDSYRYALDCTDTAKIARYASRLSRREFGAPSGKLGEEEVRLLSAVTPGGVRLFEETVQALCPQAVFIEDDHGAASRVLLAHLRTHALACGLDIVSCYCPMSPLDKLDHLLIPGLGLAFLSGGCWHEHPAVTPVRRIHAERFLCAEQLRQRRQRMSFNRRTASDLIGEAARQMAAAKSVHDRLEDCYKQAMDFDRLNEWIPGVIERFFAG